jgi:hypothetical protein
MKIQSKGRISESGIKINRLSPRDKGTPGFSQSAMGATIGCAPNYFSFFNHF